MILIKIFVLIVLIIMLTIISSVTLTMYSANDRGKHLSLKILILQFIATLLHFYTIIN
jgi:hypothetical protein